MKMKREGGGAMDGWGGGTFTAEFWREAGKGGKQKVPSSSLD
jgi:hypothetical protein